MFEPEWGIWFFPIALLPGGMRIIAGQFPFRRTPLNWFIIIFLATAWVGYWAAYDETSAWNKAWLIVLAVLLYYALAAQPKENLFWVSLLFFCVGVGVSLYFLLTYDFVAAPRKLEFVNRIGTWLMGHRPHIGWDMLHPNYMSGIAAITAPLILYPAWEIRKNSAQRKFFFVLFVLPTLSILVFAVLMATSRGVAMAIFSGMGVGLLWQFLQFNGFKQRVQLEAVFPLLVLVYLGVIVVVLYTGPAHSTGAFSGNYYYGDGSRAELATRSLYLLEDFAITGGGLGAFPGLYSRYLLDIPHFNVSNSHNVFLDVAIEQGILGGASYLLMYLISIWSVSRTLTQASTTGESVYRGTLLFSLVVAFAHGMVDDYLYNGYGTLLSLFLVGLSMPGVQLERRAQPQRHKLNPRIVGGGLFALAFLLALHPAKIQSIWYANLGAVQLSKVELDGFPEKGWSEPGIVPRLAVASRTLQTALRFDPDNRTANQRLGLILMLDQDFETACRHLVAAYQGAPDHRGLFKSLAYCYVWSGKMEKAGPLLSQIPEAREEMGVYVWWWETQGRADVSENALTALHLLETQSNQP